MVTLIAILTVLQTGHHSTFKVLSPFESEQLCQERAPNLITFVVGEVVRRGLIMRKALLAGVAALSMLSASLSKVGSQINKSRAGAKRLTVACRRARGNSCRAVAHHLFAALRPHSRQVVLVRGQRQPKQSEMSKTGSR